MRLDPLKPVTGPCTTAYAARALRIPPGPDMRSARRTLILSGPIPSPAAARRRGREDGEQRARSQPRRRMCSTEPAAAHRLAQASRMLYDKESTGCRCICTRLRRRRLALPASLGGRPQEHHVRVIQSSPSTQSSTVCAGPPLPLSTCGRPQSAATPGTVNRRAYADACALAIQTADRHADEMLRTHHEQIVDGSSGAPPLTCPGWLCRTRVFTERGEQAWAGKRHTRSRMAVPSTPLLQRLDSLWRHRR